MCNNITGSRALGAGLWLLDRIVGVAAAESKTGLDLNRGSRCRSLAGVEACVRINIGSRELTVVRREDGALFALLVVVMFIILLALLRNYLLVETVVKPRTFPPKIRKSHGVSMAKLQIYRKTSTRVETVDHQEIGEIRLGYVLTASYSNELRAGRRRTYEK